MTNGALLDTLAPIVLPVIVIIGENIQFIYIYGERVAAHFSPQTLNQTRLNGMNG